MDDKSVFVKKLEELGFERFDPQRVMRRILSVEFVEDEGDKISPEEPTHMKMPLLAPNEPCFVCMDGSAIDPRFNLTIAYDDTGQAWKKRELIDLSPHGFTSFLDRVPMQ